MSVENVYIFLLLLFILAIFCSFQWISLVHNLLKFPLSISQFLFSFTLYLNFLFAKYPLLHIETFSLYLVYHLKISIYHLPSQYATSQFICYIWFCTHCFLNVDFDSYLISCFVVFLRNSYSSKYRSNTISSMKHFLALSELGYLLNSPKALSGYLHNSIC